MKNKKQRNDREEKIAHADPYHELAVRTYESLLKDRIILLNGDIKENVIEKVAIPILNMSRTHPRTPIQLYINSEGGSADDGQAIVDLIQQTKTPVITVGLGKVMSVAFDIFLAGDMRMSQPNTLFMCHSGYNAVADRMPMINDIAALQHEYFQRWARYYASRTKWNYQQWFDLFNGGKDRFFFPEEALKVGIVTDITPNQPKILDKIKTKSPRKKSRKSKVQKRKK